MHQFARLFLLWIIAIALPVQGVFAGSMQHCVGSEHQVAFEDSSPDAHPHDEALGGDEHSGHHHMHAHAEMHQHADQSGSSHSHHAGLKGSCSACAACCSSTAPPPTTIVLVPQQVEQSVSSFVSFAVVTFVTDGPERPPRITLA